MGILSLSASLFKIHHRIKEKKNPLGVFYIRSQEALLLSWYSHPHTAVLLAPVVLIKAKLENEEMS